MARLAGLKEAIKFHGHLGPYLVLGLLAGELALKKLKAKKHFGIEVKVWGALNKPKSCLIDGLQLSTGATYGKGNIEKKESKNIKVVVVDRENRNSVELGLKNNLISSLEKLKDHKDSEAFAKRIYKVNPQSLFYLTPRFFPFTDGLPNNRR